MARPLSPLLSREKIAQTAIEMIDAGDELKIQPLAKKLGVSLSSLYHHVDGREGIVHAMREVLSSEYSFRALETGSWKDKVREGVNTLWRLYSDHPKVMVHLLGVTVEDADALILYEGLLEGLRQAGVPEDELLTTIEVLDAFAFGAALDALSPTVIFSPRSSESPLARLIEEHPTGEVRNRLLYRNGLDIIIAGIESRVREG